MYVSPPFEPAPGASPVEAQLQRVILDLKAAVAQREGQVQALARAQLETLLRLALAAQCRDGDTGVHIVRLGQIAGLLAQVLTGDRDYAALLCQAAPMHDIGKIGVPDTVLKKAGSLDADEWAVMRGHPTIGARILGGSPHPLFRLAADVALHHHERFDGSGYPYGLRGEEISQGARIVALADVYDALTMDRVYRPGWTHPHVVDMIRAQAGSHFDPRVVDAFLEHADRIDALRARVNERFADRSLEQEGINAFLPMF